MSWSPVRRRPIRAIVLVLPLILVASCGASRGDQSSAAPTVLRPSDAVLVSPGRGLREVASFPVALGGTGVQPEAITTDGQVLRSVPEGQDGTPGFRTRYELLDPRTGVRTTLPTYPIRYGRAVEAGRDLIRLVADRPRLAVLTYDRRSRSWSRVVAPRLPGPGHVVTRTVSVAASRVWVEKARAPDPSTLWSFPLAGGVARKEAVTAGYSAAGDLLAYAEPSQDPGRDAVLHLRTLATGKQRTVRLPGCRIEGEAPNVAGNDRWLAVRATCAAYQDDVTPVLVARGHRVADLALPADSLVSAVNDRFVLLAGQYAFDPADRRLLRLSDYGFELDGWPDGDERGDLLGYADSAGGRHDDQDVRLHLARVTR